MTSFHDPSSAVLAGCRDIPQAPGPEKGVLALLVMDPATYMPQAVTFGVTCAGFMCCKKSKVFS